MTRTDPKRANPKLANPKLANPALADQKLADAKLADPAFVADATVEVDQASVWFGQKVALSELACSFGPGRHRTARAQRCRQEHAHAGHHRSDRRQLRPGAGGGA